MTTIETAAEWMGSLGYHVSGDHADYSHPICGEETLAAALDAHHRDGDVLRALIAAGEIGADDMPRECALDLIAYARAGYEAGQTIEDALTRAVEAHEGGRIADAVEALDEASRAEMEYGDDPATCAVATDLGMMSGDSRQDMLWDGRTVSRQHRYGAPIVWAHDGLGVAGLAEDLVGEIVDAADEGGTIQAVDMLRILPAGDPTIHTTCQLGAALRAAGAAVLVDGDGEEVRS